MPAEIGSEVKTPCCLENQRSVVKFLFLGGRNATEIHRRLKLLQIEELRH